MPYLSNNIALRTPLIPGPCTKKGSGPKVWLKLEALQPSGSFKLRGMAAKAVESVHKGARHFVSSSGGNAGLAVAYAGKNLSIPVSVFVPKTTPKTTVERLTGLGAEVTVSGEHWREAHEMAELHKDSTPRSVLFHPFDDPTLWKAYADIIRESVEDGVVPDLVVCSVGGGGLLSGLAEGLASEGLSHVPILAVETEGADSLHQSRLTGTHVTLKEIRSRAKSLGAPKVCSNAWQLLQNAALTTMAVSDMNAELACYRFLEDYRIKVELACGAALVPIFEREHTLIKNSKNVLVVVCGGVN